MIKTGEVAFLKTTGECVFVLNTQKPDSTNYPSSMDTVVKVRRPVGGQYGIMHVQEDFFLEELESLDDQRSRFLAEQKELMVKYGPKAAELPSITDTGLQPN